ncbi:MAG: polysulfide reductase NrfD, partial [Desulfobacteraceae bacterium]
MNQQTRKLAVVGPWIRDNLFLGLNTREYIKKIMTPFNVVAGVIVLIGLYFIVLRFSQGLAAITRASDVQPWGLTLALGLFSVVPLSASGYVLGSAVYLFRLKEYYPVVKNAILIGFLGYFFAVVFLLIDLGRPWRIYYPMFVSYGPASVMFLVAWHVALYLSCQALEFSPSAFEWLGFKTLRKWAL